MNRLFAAAITLALVAEGVAADCLVLKKGGKLQLWGIAPTVGTAPNTVEVTPENVELYAEESTGVIDAEGYDGVTVRKSDKTKATEFYPWSEVAAVYYSSEPAALAEGLDAMALGQYPQAISAFREAVGDPESRDTFKYRAQFMIGICFYQAARMKDCIAHFKAWPPVNSRYTPEAYRVLAEIYTDQRQFPAARAQYEEIAKLPNIPDDWKYKARLGGVKVDTAERKFDDSERTAAAIAKETQGKADIVDAHVLALCLQADAILQSGKADRLPEAQAILDRAVKIDGASPGTRAFLLVTQGHVLYAQGKLEEARFPYLRAALMYPDSGFDGSAYHNAGQCFIDMSGRLEGKDQAKSDTYLVKGMQLLATAAGRFKNKDAAKRYAEHKKRYDEIVAKQGGGGEEAGEPGK